MNRRFERQARLEAELRAWERDRNVRATKVNWQSQAGSDLLQRAHDANAVRLEVSITELLTLINAISLVTEHDPEGEVRAERLFDVVIEGIYPRAHLDTHTS